MAVNTPHIPKIWSYSVIPDVANWTKSAIGSMSTYLDSFVSFFFASSGFDVRILCIGMPGNNSRLYSSIFCSCSADGNFLIFSYSPLHFPRSLHVLSFFVHSQFVCIFLCWITNFGFKAHLLVKINSLVNTSPASILYLSAWSRIGKPMVNSSSCILIHCKRCTLNRYRCSAR